MNGHGGVQALVSQRSILPRSRLVEPLIGADAAPIVVVQGPPGLGKSILLDHVARRLGEDKVTRLHPDEDFAAIMEDHRVRADSATDKTMVLMDGVVEPDDDAVRAAVLAVRELGMRLLVTTRTAPSWVTADRLLDGTVHVVGTQDLLFESSETTLLAGRLKVLLSDDDLAELSQATDGWPALVVAALRARRPGATITGRQLQDVIDRFVRLEVLGDLDDDDRDLIMDAAAVPRLDASVLAFLLTDRQERVDPAALIDRWAAAGRLIHDSDAGHWRMPEPIRQSLLADLAVKYPGRRAQLVTQAVRNLVAGGRTAEALPLVVDRSLDKMTAGRVVSASWQPAVLRGRFTDLLPAVNTLPDDVIAADPVLSLLAAISALAPPFDVPMFARRLGQADALIDQTTLSAPLLAVRAFQMMLGRIRGDVESAREAERSVQLRIDAATDEQRRELTDRMMYLSWQVGVTRLAEGDLDAAESALGSAVSVAGRNEALWYEANADAVRAYTSFLRGDLAAAERQVRSATEISRRMGWSGRNFTDHLYLTRGLLDLEYGRTADVAASLHEAQRALERDAEPPAARLAWAWSVLAMLREDASMAVHAELLSGAEYDTNRLPLNRLTAAIARAHLLLVRDDPKAALLELDETIVPAGQAAVLAIARARSLLALNDPVGADRELAALGDPSKVSSLTHRADLHALRIESALRHGHDAESSFHHLLALIERTGSLRPILLLPTLRDSVVSGHLTLPPSGPLSTLAVEIAALHRASTTNPPALSERETEVLTALAGPSTLVAIAKSLYVSNNTLKTTTRSIYRKLGAADRHQAVSVARALAILPPAP